MKTRLNKKNDTVTLTLNRDELWHIRTALADISVTYAKLECSNLSTEAWEIREATDKAFDYLFGDVQTQIKFKERI